MKVIKFIHPKRAIDDVSKCDSCGSKFKTNKNQFRSLDFSRFLCEKCKEGVDRELLGCGIDTKGYWKTFKVCVQTVPEKIKPYRPRGRHGKCAYTTANNRTR
jgi:transposase-like protein